MPRGRPPKVRNYHVAHDEQVTPEVTAPEEPPQEVTEEVAVMPATPPPGIHPTTWAEMQAGRKSIERYAGMNPDLVLVDDVAPQQRDKPSPSSVQVSIVEQPVLRADPENAFNERAQWLGNPHPPKNVAVQLDNSYVERFAIPPPKVTITNAGD